MLRVGSRTYTWLDAVLAAMLRGDWVRFESHLAAGAACAEEADRAGAWPDADEAEAAATDFRYARDLLTTEETEAWLASAGLSIETWSEVLARDVLRARWAHRLAALTAQHDRPPDYDEDLVTAEGVCSGMFAAFAQALADRLAVAEMAEAVDSSTVAADVAATVQAHAAWLSGLDPRDVERRLAHLAHVNGVHASTTRAAVDEAALSQHLDRYRLEWMRIDLEQLSFSTAEAAREAAWCVREDGLTLSEVAMESKQAVADVRTLLDGLTDPLRDAVLSAQLEEVVGPIEIDGRYQVALVVGKTPPTLADPLVRARAERSVVEALTARAVLSHVVWIEKPPL